MKQKNNVIKIDDYKKRFRPFEYMIERIKDEYLIDFDAEIRNNAKTIPEKIAVFIWEHTGKTGYLYIEDGVNAVFWYIKGIIFIVFLALFFTLVLAGVEKIWMLLQ